MKCSACGKQISALNKLVAIHGTVDNPLCAECAKTALPSMVDGNLDQSKVNQLRELEIKLQSIMISTGDIRRDYEGIGVLFALDSADEGILGAMMQYAFNGSLGADPGKAFDKVIKQLQYQCYNRGGNAVINCQFQHRVSNSRGIGGTGIGVTQAVEIFAYGTAVKFM